MGRRGPIPEATTVKLDRGTFRPDRDGGRFDAVPVSGAPIRPSDIGTDGAALWDDIIAMHAARKTLGRVDSSSLAQLCRTWDVCQAAFAIVKTNPTDKDSRCSYLGYLAACDKLGAKFGWTPGDRANLKLGGGEQKPSVPTRARA
jgi:phage terminase small subunit